MTGPIGPTGPPGTGTQGPTGPMGQGRTGPVGPTGTVQGPTGAGGPFGPKNTTSVVRNQQGIYSFALLEMTEPFFMDIRRKDEPIDAKFLAAVAGEVHHFLSECGGYVLHLARRREFPGWRMEPATLKQAIHSWKFWAQEHLNQQAA